MHGHRSGVNGYRLRVQPVSSLLNTPEVACINNAIPSLTLLSAARHAFRPGARKSPCCSACSRDPFPTVPTDQSAKA